jgi:hypothetical protein
MRLRPIRLVVIFSVLQTSRSGRAGAASDCAGEGSSATAAGEKVVAAAVTHRMKKRIPLSPKLYSSIVKQSKELVKRFTAAWEFYVQPDLVQ